MPNKLFAQKDFYIPKALIIPLHDEPKQLFMSVGWGGGLDLNLSYAVTNKFAVFGSATVNDGNRSGSSLMGDKYTVNKNDYVLKTGIGYFSKIDNRLFGLFEAYIGTAITKVDNFWYFKNFQEEADYTDAKYKSIFGQVNLGKRKGKIEYAIGLRLNYSNYSDLNFFNSHPNLRYIRTTYQNLHGLSADPAVSFSYNLNKIRFNAQAGLAFPLSSSSALKTDTHTTYDGSTPIITEVVSNERLSLGALIGRLSVQYSLNFAGGKK